MRKIQSGFTLIELMIVIAIIGILAAIAIPAYQDYTVRAQISEGLNLAGKAKTAMDEFYSAHGSFPSSNTSAAMESPTSITGNYVTSVHVTAGLITVTYGHEANQQIRGQTLLLSVSTVGRSNISWTCKRGTLSNKYLPSSCR